MKIIMSIRDEHLQNIKEGKKTVELRKTHPKGIAKNNPEGEPVHILFYNTKTKRIEVEAFAYWYEVQKAELPFCQYQAILQDSCVSQELLYEYFKNTEKISYYHLRTIKQIEEPFALPEGKKSPQSWLFYQTYFN